MEGVFHSELYFRVVSLCFFNSLEGVSAPVRTSHVVVVLIRLFKHLPEASINGSILVLDLFDVFLQSSDLVTVLKLLLPQLLIDQVDLLTMCFLLLLDLLSQFSHEVVQDGLLVFKILHMVLALLQVFSELVHLTLQLLFILVSYLKFF